MTTTTPPPEASETHKESKLLSLTDDGTTNNYGEFSLKAKFKLVNLGVWKYIEGPTSVPPVIPELVLASRIEGKTDTNVATHIVIAGNKVAIDAAEKAAIPWNKGNNRAMTLIVSALPASALHLARGQTLAKTVWNNVRDLYQPRNTMRATSKLTDIVGYKCEDGMNVDKWLNDMQSMYNELVEMDIDKLSDISFARTVVDLMPSNVEWRGFVSLLRSDMIKAEKELKEFQEEAVRKGLPMSSFHPGLSSMNIMAKIKDEYWAQHKDDPEYTACYDRQVPGLSTTS